MTKLVYLESEELSFTFNFQSQLTFDNFEMYVGPSKIFFCFLNAEFYSLMKNYFAWCFSNAKRLTVSVIGIAS